MFLNKYNIIEKIKEGNFGSVFKAENIRTKELVAIKLETKNNDIKTLKNEAKIYQYLGKLDGFPKLKWFGTNNNINYLVINLLGTSLSSLIYHYKKLTIIQSLTIGIQIIQRVSVLHSKLLLHRDLKPDNFLFGLETETNKLYLIDFGLCKRYEYNGKHIEPKNIKQIIGSPNFVSLNVHKGIEPSRRDDIESCIYIISYMILGNMEWFNCSINDNMKQMKQNLINNTTIPNFIRLMLKHVYQLKFEEKPDYDYLINLMVSIIQTNT
jgi:serine/threonine protein kinase